MQSSDAKCFLNFANNFAVVLFTDIQNVPCETECLPLASRRHYSVYVSVDRRHIKCIFTGG